LFEREHLGGSCVNFGCTPSKALIASARVAGDARNSAALGIYVSGLRVDFAAAMARARRLAEEGADELACSFADDKHVRLVRERAGLAGIDGGFFIRVGDPPGRAGRVVLDTGTAPRGHRYPVCLTYRSSRPRIGSRCTSCRNS